MTVLVGRRAHSLRSRGRLGRQRGYRLLQLVGISLVIVGLLLLGFWAYLLFGTAIAEHADQRRLAAQLSREFPPRAATPRAPTPRAATPSTPAAAPPAAQPTEFTWPSLADGDAVARLEIPKIGLSAVVVEGTGTFDLREGPGHYPGTPLPGQPGNVAIAGHRTTYARPFYDLNELTRGDLIILSAGGRSWRYVTTGTFSVLPTDLAVAAPLRAPGSWVTLTTCTPRYSAAMRLVVRAHLEEGAPPVAPPTTAGTATPQHALPPPGATTDSPNGGSWWQVALRGALVGALALGGVYSWRALRRSRWRRPTALAIGALGLVGLWGLFGAVAALLPAGF